MLHENHQILEGIGNEVFVVFVLGSLLLLSLGFFTSHLWLRNNVNENNLQQRIHHPTAPDLYHQGDTRTATAQEINNRIASSLGHQCPVCLNEVNHPIQTNCGHIFCSQCMIEYWRHGNWPRAVLCPICRQQVSVLLRCSDSNPEGSNQRENANQINYEINEYNRRFASGPIPWVQYLWDLPILLRHVLSDLFSFDGMVNMMRFRILLCFMIGILYLVSPLDILPEALFGVFGLLDDILIIFLLAVYISLIYRAFLARMWENA